MYVCTQVCRFVALSQCEPPYLYRNRNFWEIIESAGTQDFYVKMVGAVFKMGGGGGEVDGGSG